MNLQLHFRYSTGKPFWCVPIQFKQWAAASVFLIALLLEPNTHQVSFTARTECCSLGGETVYLQYTVEITNTWSYTSHGKFHAPAALPQS